MERTSMIVQYFMIFACFQILEVLEFKKPHSCQILFVSARFRQNLKPSKQRQLWENVQEGFEWAIAGAVNADLLLCLLQLTA